MKIIIAAMAALAAATVAIAPAAQAATVPVLYGDDASFNWHDPDIRPHGTDRWIFGAGRQYITRMSWSHWGANNASGSGTIHRCSFSGGTFHCHRHHVRMYLYQVRSHNGHKYYRKLTLRWPNHVQRLFYGKHGGTAVWWG